jgi:hypothetical protein
LFAVLVVGPFAPGCDREVSKFQGSLTKQG